MEVLSKLINKPINENSLEGFVVKGGGYHTYFLLMMLYYFVELKRIKLGIFGWFYFVLKIDLGKTELILLGRGDNFDNLATNFSCKFGCGTR